MELASLSLTELQTKLRAGECTPVDAVESVASAAEARDSDIGAYLSLDLDAARARGIPVCNAPGKNAGAVAGVAAVGALLGSALSTSHVFLVVAALAVPVSLKPKGLPTASSAMLVVAPAGAGMTSRPRPSAPRSAWRSRPSAVHSPNSARMT